MTDRNGFRVERDPLVDEEVWLAETGDGLRVRVMPTDRFAESAAIATFRYGSTDLGFRRGGTEHESPEGVAHYLEHKLFEDEEIQAFQRFAARGAKVNAMTGFTRTSYHFTATSQVEENLVDLLGLVSRAHVTPENVDKERGIIAQEIRMYEDSADYRLFFDFLGCLYEQHPVRHPVGGTVESIQGITADELLTCFDAFYRTGNAALAVAGPVDPHMVLAVAERCGLAAGDRAESLWPEDLGPVATARRERRLQMPRTKVYAGFKDRTLVADAEERLRRQLLSEVLLDRMFSASSEIREDLRQRDVVDDSLSSTYMSDFSFGFTLLDCETSQPDAVVEELRKALFTPVTVDEEYLERVRRKFLGRYVRSFASVRGLAFAHGQEALEDLAPFKALERLEWVTAESVCARQEEHFKEDAFAVVVGEAAAE